MEKERKEESQEIEILEEGVDREVHGVSAPCCIGGTFVPIR